MCPTHRQEFVVYALAEARPAPDEYSDVDPDVLTHVAASVATRLTPLGLSGAGVPASVALCSRCSVARVLYPRHCFSGPVSTKVRTRSGAGGKGGGVRGGQTSTEASI